MSDMKIKALAPWFGSKRNLASKIVEQLGPHSAYWEPFCGSMSVLLAKPESSHEHVNDLHGDLINLARVVQDPALGPQLFRRLRRTLHHEALYDESRNGDSTEPLQRAYDYFIASWFGRNGVSGTPSYNTTSYAVRWTPFGGHGGKRFSSAVNSIPAWRRRLRRVTILQRDAFAMLERIDDNPVTAIYIDPPYLKKGSRYVYDFCADDHTRLAALLHRFKKSRVVVSYYDHPRLAELYPDWTKLTFDVSKAMAHQGRRGANDVRAVECLLINGPACGSLPADATLFED